MSHLWVFLNHVTLHDGVVPFNYLNTIKPCFFVCLFSFSPLYFSKMQFKLSIFSIIFFVSNWCYAQLVVPYSNCTLEQSQLCDFFLLEGGLTCQRNNQSICYHAGEQNVLNLTTSAEMLTQDYCTSNATYNCRTFISRYGYKCNLFECVQSNNIV